jgi:hypothetical protein
MDNNSNLGASATPLPLQAAVVVDANSDLKTLFSDFITCKEQTLEMMNHVNSAKSPADLTKIIDKQESCIKIIGALELKYQAKTTKYENGIKSTSVRIHSERSLLMKTLAGDPNSVTFGYYVIPRMREKEAKEWKMIEDKVKSPEKDDSFHPSGFLLGGWIVSFVFVLLILMKRKDAKSPLPFDSQKVKLYFDNERIKYSSFFIKFFKKDENDKK